MSALSNRKEAASASVNEKMVFALPQIKQEEPDLAPRRARVIASEKIKEAALRMESGCIDLSADSEDEEPQRSSKCQEFTEGSSSDDEGPLAKRQKKQKSPRRPSSPPDGNQDPEHVCIGYHEQYPTRMK